MFSEGERCGQCPEGRCDSARTSRVCETESGTPSRACNGPHDLRPLLKGKKVRSQPAYLRLLAVAAVQWPARAGEPGRVLTDTCASSACRTAPNALVLHAPTASALCRVDAGHGRRRPPLAYGSTQQCLALHILAPPHVAQVAAPSRCCCLRRGCKFPAGLMDQPANLARIRQDLVRRRQDTSASL